jgi:predicted glutamine amidotransferase
MCRLIGAISSTKMNAQHLLCASAQSLLRQSDIDRRRKQGDGWGIGYFDRGLPKIIKSPRAMYHDRMRVNRAAVKAKGNTLIGHVRWASNPLKLKRNALIGLTHTQPFTHRRWIFAHNGTLYIPKEVAAHLGPWETHIRGKNDSEVLFYWLMKHLLGAKNPAQAIRKSIRGIHRIWDGCKKSYPIHPYPYHGLNWVLTNGQTLLAFCYTDPRGFGKSKALCNRRDRYYQLRRKVTPDEVIITSEPLDKGAGWEGFRHGELLIAKRHRNRVLTRTVWVL